MLPLALLVLTEAFAHERHYDIQITENLSPEEYDQKLENYLSWFSTSAANHSRFGRFKREDPETETRSLRHLKLLVVAMMDPEISKGYEGTGYGRYNYYGCHCLPSPHNEEHGFGTPIDMIDQQCQQLNVCYKCLERKHLNCKAKDARYKFKLNEKSIDCSMNSDPCNRDLCECDRQAALGLAQYEHTWKEEHHIKLAGFDRSKECPVPKTSTLTQVVSSLGADMGLLPIPGDSFAVPSGTGALFSQGSGFPSSSTGGQFVSTHTCCNMENFPNVFAVPSSHACCGDKDQVSYNTLTHKCCYGKVIFTNEVCV